MGRSLLLLAIAGGALVTFAVLPGAGTGGPTITAARGSSAPVDRGEAALGEIRDVPSAKDRVAAAGGSASRAPAARTALSAPPAADALRVNVTTRLAARREAGHTVALVLKGAQGGEASDLVLDRARTDARGLATLCADRHPISDAASIQRLAVRLEESRFVGYDVPVRGLAPGGPWRGHARIQPFEGFVQSVQVLDGHGRPVPIQPDISGGLARRVERVTGVPTVASLGGGLTNVLVVDDPRGHVIAQDPALGHGGHCLTDLLAAGPSRAPVEIRLAGWSVVRGRLLNAFGEGLADVPLRFVRTSLGTDGGPGRESVGKSSARATTDGAGAFRFVGLAEGVYGVACGSFEDPIGPFVSVESHGETSIELEWNRVWVEFTATARGTAPSGTTVSCELRSEHLLGRRRKLASWQSAQGPFRCLLEPGNSYEALVRETRRDGRTRERRVAIEIPDGGAATPFVLPRPDRVAPWNAAPSSVDAVLQRFDW